MIILFLFISMVSGTLFLGWPAIPTLGFLYGLTTRQTRPCTFSALVAVSSWLLLLVWRSLNGDVHGLLETLENSTNIPGWLLMCITLTSSGILGAASTNLGIGTRLALQKLSTRVSD